MRVLHQTCAGMDVHKKEVKVCLVTRDSERQRQEDIRSFRTMPRDLLAMRAWLQTQECWRTQKCRNWCVPHACCEGKKAGETSPRESALSTLKEVGPPYPGDKCPQALMTSKTTRACAITRCKCRVA